MKRIDPKLLLALEREATPGVWYAEVSDTDGGRLMVRESDGAPWLVATTTNSQDARFLSAIRNAVGAGVLTELMSLRIEVDQARPTINRLNEELNRALAKVKHLQRRGKLDAAAGGVARAKKLTAKQRSEIAKNAVAARWKKNRKVAA